MQPIVVSVGPLASASANNIATSQTVSGAGSVSLDGALVTDGVAYLDTPRQVKISSAGNDTGITFTVTGTTFGNVSVSQTVTGTSGSSVSTTVDFATVTSITTSGSTSASGITVGTNGVAGSRWVRFDSWANNNTAIQCNVTGTANYTIQVTMDDPYSPTNPVAVTDVTWSNTNDADAVGATSDVFSNFQFTPTFARVVLNSGSGSVTTTFAQFNVVNK